MRMSGKGQVAIPAQLRAKYGSRAGDELEVIEADGRLQIVRAAGGQGRGQRMVERLSGTAAAPEIAGLSTDQLMSLLRGEDRPEEPSSAPDAEQRKPGAWNGKVTIGPDSDQWPPT